MASLGLLSLAPIFFAQPHPFWPDGPQHASSFWALKEVLSS